MNKEELTKLITDKLVGKKRQAAVAEIKRLEAEHGTLTTRLVVDTARSTKSPLHAFFEWDDDVAAEKFRLTQAGLLIRTIKVIVTMPDLKPREIRAFVSPTRGGGYINIVSVLTQKDLREQLLAQARLDLEAFQRRYSTLEELSDVFKVIKFTLRRTSKKKRKRAA